MDTIILFFLIIAIDYLYLSFVSKPFKKLIMNIQGEPVKLNYMYIFLVYVFITLQIYLFLIVNNTPLIYAFLLGFTTYGIYDMTNASILKKWNIQLSIIDIIWGGTLYALVFYLFSFYKNTSIQL